MIYSRSLETLCIFFFGLPLFWERLSPNLFLYNEPHITGRAVVTAILHTFSQWWYTQIDYCGCLRGKIHSM